jgi:ribosomal protein S18 acetylase RimI-like enzyme
MSASTTQEQRRSGLPYLETATALLQRVRRVDHTAGLLEAADLQWWWRTPRKSDDLPQLFWFDDDGHPEAAVVITDWGDGIALDPIVMPDATPDWARHVLKCGLAHASDLGFKEVEVVVDRTDEVARELLVRHGFVVKPSEKLDVVLAWLPSAARSTVGTLPKGYRLYTRAETRHRAHHMIRRNGNELETRLAQASLYSEDLDLLLLDDRGEVAAYGLFWFDAATSTGLVEPMRTEDSHQRCGLARHILATGIERLAAAGARNIKVCFKPANAAARELYLGAGFRPYKQTIILSHTEIGGAA